MKMSGVKIRRLDVDQIIFEEETLETSEVRYMCHLCLKKCASKSQLERHMSNHVDDRLWECDICEKKFRTEAMLDQHMNIHYRNVRANTSESEEPVRILKATRGRGRPRKFAQPPQINGYEDDGQRTKPQIPYHLVKGPLGRYPCDRCEDKFDHVHELMEHRLGEHEEEGDDLNRCDLCDQEFEAMNVFQKHMETHKIKYKIHTDRPKKGEMRQPIKCPFCDEKFILSGDLNDHILEAHEQGQESFTCIVCHQTFTSQRDMLNHRRTEHRNQPDKLRCPFCSGMFATHSALMEHFSSFHQREKPDLQFPEYPCDLCQLSFSRIQDLSDHKAATHPESFRVNRTTPLPARPAKETPASKIRAKEDEPSESTVESYLLIEGENYIEEGTDLNFMITHNEPGFYNFLPVLSNASNAIDLQDQPAVIQVPASAIQKVTSEMQAVQAVQADQSSFQLIPASQVIGEPVTAGTVTAAGPGSAIIQVTSVSAPVVTASEMEIPAAAVEIPATAVEIPTAAVEIPAAAVEIPTVAVEIPADSIEVAVENVATEIPAGSIEVTVENITEVAG